MAIQKKYSNKRTIRKSALEIDIIENKFRGQVLTDILLLLQKARNGYKFGLQYHFSPDQFVLKKEWEQTFLTLLVIGCNTVAGPAKFWQICAYSQRNFTDAADMYIFFRGDKLMQYTA